MKNLTLRFLFLTMLIGFSTWFFNCSGSSTTTATNPAQVATPVISPAGGTYSYGATVTITCSTVGSTIYYTTDGTTPTSGSFIYTGAITISRNDTVQAFAVSPGMTNSLVASAVFVSDYPEALEPNDTVLLAQRIPDCIPGTSVDISGVMEVAGVDSFIVNTGSCFSITWNIYWTPVADVLDVDILSADGFYTWLGGSSQAVLTNPTGESGSWTITVPLNADVLIDMTDWASVGDAYWGTITFN